MSWTQLKPVDMSVMKTAGRCLEFAEDSFDVPNLYDSAWQGWESAQYKHKDKDFPKGVYVPVWFDWTGSVQWTDGVWRTLRYGHVAYTKDGKVYSSPPTGYGRAWFNSVDDLVNAFGGGMKYVGWSEDIAGIRVVKEESMSKPNTQQLHDMGTAVYRAIFGREPENSNAAVAMGKKMVDKNGELTPASFISGVQGERKASEWIERNNKAKTATTASVKLDKASVLSYVTRNLK